jgi:hypothetical protein
MRNVACFAAPGCDTTDDIMLYLNEARRPTAVFPAHRTSRSARFVCRAAMIVSGWLFLVLLCGWLQPGIAAQAPDGQADLTGVADATMGVSQLTADGAQCGLELSRIGMAAHQTVADAGIALRDEASNRMTISAVTARVGQDQCATAVLLGVYAKESFFSATAGWVQSGYVVLWQRSVMVATPIGQHAAAVADATRRLTAQMLIDWRALNPRPMSAVQPGDTNRSGNSSRLATQTTPAAPKAIQ